MKRHERAGRSAPLGATVVDGGVNFSVFSRNATGMELVLFDREDEALPSRVIARRMMLDDLRYRLGETHVDGFRFDLASILLRRFAFKGRDTLSS